MCSNDALYQAIHTDGCILLDGSGWTGGGGLLFTGPEVVMQPRTRAELIDSLEELDAAVERGAYVAGMFTYEAGEHFVLEEARPTGRPLAWIGVYSTAPIRLRDDPNNESGDVAVTGIDFKPDRAAYSDSFATVKHHIHEGDVYQINLTGRGVFRYAGAAIDLYRELRRRQPAAYGALINTGDRLVMSFSPELFFECEGNRIRTRPMKGTAPRDTDPERDDGIRNRLASDPKNRAENLMIVDLLRNDLSVVCRPGSVRASRMFEVEQLPTLWQMTSDVVGELHRGTPFSRILRALFPSGSITDAPMRRAMQIIRSIVPDARGVYCGAIGYVAPDHTSVFNVAIRTIEIDGTVGRIDAGGGIVWDSVEQAEFEEMHLKTRFCAGIDIAELDSGFHLIETMRVENGAVPRLELHIERLNRSARFFGLDAAAVQSAILEACEGVDRNAVLRVTLDRASSVSVEIGEGRVWPNRPASIAIAPQTVSSTDPYRYHKSSVRDEFEEAMAWATRHALDEAILTNENGYLTEGVRSTIFLRQGDRWLTPDVTSGVLPGVYRQWMIQSGKAEEAFLTPKDLQRADEIMIANAVRGRTAAHLVNVT